MIRIAPRGTTLRQRLRLVTALTLGLAAGTLAAGCNNQKPEERKLPPSAAPAAPTAPTAPTAPVTPPGGAPAATPGSGSAGSGSAGSGSAGSGSAAAAGSAAAGSAEPTGSPTPAGK
jgi:hypothetical protein